MLGGSLACIKKIMREEGIRGFYKGLSASYLGVTEGTIQWVLYERLKKLSTAIEGQSGLSQWFAMLGSAGSAKFVASMITYPHEVCPFFLSSIFFLLKQGRIFFDINRCSGLDFDNQVLTESSNTQACGRR